jgi:hypothetical protein
MDLANATGLTPLVKPFVELLNPVFKVIINLAYHRNANPGIPQTFQLFPIVNPATLTVQLVTAVFRGIDDAVNDISGGIFDPPAPVAPTGPSTSSIFAAPKLGQNATTVIQAPKLDPPRDNSVVVSTLKTDPKPNTSLGTQPPTGDTSQTTPTVNGTAILPFNLPQLPKPTNSPATPSNPPKAGKPGDLIQRVTVPLSDAINGLTHPGAATTPAGGTNNQAGANSPSSGSRAAA